MKKTFFKVSALIAILIAVALAFTACGNDDDDETGGTTGGGGAVTNDGGGTTGDTGSGGVSDEERRASIHGHVVFADYAWNEHRLHHQLHIDRFMERFPNITVERIYSDWNMPEDLTAWAAAGTMPDVALGWDAFPFYATQGWLFPLDEFVVNDFALNYVPDLFTTASRFNGMLYLLPAWIQFDGIFINLDLLDQLNLDPPPMNWTTDDFLNFARIATTTTTSALSWSNLHETMFGQFSPGMSIQGFDYRAGRFNFLDPSWTAVMELDGAMREVPGLIASTLVNQDLRDAGELDDHQRKFGVEADLVREHLILMDPVGTWSTSWLRELTFNIDVWPLPQAPGSSEFRFPIHADYGFMLATAQYPEAAYEFLRWMTICPEGLVSRFYRDQNPFDVNPETGEVTEGTREMALPASTHPSVMAAMADIEIFSGFMFQFENLMTPGVWMGDPQKLVPNFWYINEPLRNARDRIWAGEISPHAIAAELNELQNAALDFHNGTFEEIMNRVQADFAASR